MIRHKKDRAQSDWLVRCCLAWVLCAQLTVFGAAAAHATTRAPATVSAASMLKDFGFAEPYFEGLGQLKSPAPVITALAQDAQGWLWIGTEYGLYRYDGYLMRKFVHDAANPASLADNYVTALWQAADGRLWVGTNSDGISVFDPQREQFTHLAHDPSNAASLAGGAIWALAGDGKGGVWIGTDDGLDYIGPGGAPSGGAPSGGAPSGGAGLRHYRHEADNPASLLDNRIRSLLLDKHGTLWVGSAAGLQRYQASWQKGAAGFVRIASDPANPASLAGQEISALFQGQDGKLWIGTSKRGAAWLNIAEPNPALHWLPPDPQRADRLSHGFVTRIIEPQAGQIWLGTFGGGINIVTTQDGTVLQRLQHNPANASSLAHDNIGTILQDHSGILWIGTWGGGLQRHHPAQQAFHVLHHNPPWPNQAQPSLPGGLSHPDVTSVLELADGRILVGTDGNGIDILDRRRGIVGGYRPRPGYSAGLAEGSVTALMQTPDGTLWTGTRQAGAWRLAPGSSQWQASAAGLPSPLVTKFLLTQDGVLWAGTASGIAHWQAQTQRFVATQQLDGSALQIFVLALTQDRKGRLWAASTDGLWLKTPQATGWQAIRNLPDRSDSLPSNSVGGLLVDASDRLWVATAKGLARLQSWDGHHAIFEQISAKAGKPGQNLGSNLWQDRKGQIWLCENELLSLNPQTLRLTRSAQPDLGTIWPGAYGATRDGLLLYGGSRGLAIFDPVKLQPWAYQPALRVTELKINGQITPPGEFLPRLRLTPEQRNFSVEFAALDFSQDAPKHYRYWLQGKDNDWTYTDAKHRLVSYSNLWPGQYILKVQGSNSEGEWSSQLFALPIEIAPAFWQTRWFDPLMLLTLAGTLWGGYRWRLAQVHARARALQREVEQRTAEALTAHQNAAQAQNETLAAQNELALARQLEQTREQMLQQEKMAALGTLTAGVAHEINNPTNFTHVAAQNQRTELGQFEQFLLGMLEDDPDPELIAEFKNRFSLLQSNISTMLNGTERIKSIVRDLRTFTRLGEAETETVHLSECLSATVNLVRTSWQEQVEFISEFADDPPCACWPALLNQMFMNLLVNGCQAIAARRMEDGSRAKGHLWLRLHQSAGTLAVEIEDDGIGMSPELQKRILEPFFTTREVGSGTGMGLSISYGIIQKHSGTLAIASTPGQGSCFTVHLPLGDLKAD